MAHPIHRRTLEVNGLPIFYREAGAGPLTVLCLHGMYGRGEDWVPFLERYADRFRILAPDQRGHGLSGKPVARYGGEEMADDARDFLRALGVEKALVVGHSMGGRNGAFLAAGNPELVSALVMVDIGTAGSEVLSTRRPEDLTAPDGFTEGWPEVFDSRLAALGQLRTKVSDEGGVRYFSDSLVETPEGYSFLFSSRAMAAVSEYWRNWDDILPLLRCPVLFLRADKSWCLSAEVASAMRPHIARCTYHEVGGSDHNLHTDNPAEFYARFEGFLGSLGSQG